VQSGELDRIRSGSYVHRGDEPPPSAEFEAAVRHYRERFAGVVQRTVGGVGKLSGQIQSWLRGAGGGSDRSDGGVEGDDVGSDDAGPDDGGPDDGGPDDDQGAAASP
jgi:hypothetical protein